MFHVKHNAYEKVKPLADRVLEKLVVQFKDIGIQLSERQRKQFGIYYYEIRNWNQRANLISKKDENRIIERHFLESCALSRFEVFRSNLSVLDLGSGGGFPGVPLKIVQPDLIMTLLDSKRMKTLFLKTLVEKLNLTGVNVICERADVVAAQSNYRHNFDIVLSRAVATLSKLYKWAHPFLNANGILLAVKGPNLVEEISTLKSEFPFINVELKSLPRKHLKRAKEQKAVFITPNEVIGQTMGLV